LRVLNYGTGGYGSYQSLLVMERELPCLVDPRFVLYGFIEHHEIRNAAPGSWLGLLLRSSKRGHVDVPFATYDAEKGLLRHPPEHYLSLPFRESLAVVALLEKAYMQLKTNQRLSGRRLLTEQILLSMNRTSKQHNAIFIVILLEIGKDAKAHYKNFLRANKIESVDCAFEITEDARVAGEGHPNGKMNTLWSQCISTALKDRFENSRLAHQARNPIPSGPSSCGAPPPAQG
jgi:hypothetical protein